MTKPTIEDLLSHSAPPTRTLEAGLRSTIRDLSAESRETARAARRPRSRLRWLITPVVLVPAIALGTTAGTEPRQIPDFTIPVLYTTDTGKEVSCSIDLFNGEIDYVETNTTAIDYFRVQDWTGIGQRIYDAALVYENDSAWLASEMNSDGPDLPQATIHWRAWVSAEDDLVRAQLPDGALAPGDGGYGSDTDCTGELH